MKRKIQRAVELTVGATIAGTLLAACGGSGTVSTGAGGTPLTIPPALGQVSGGQVTVTGSNGITRSYPVQSGVPSITADIAGMTAPLLISLSGDPANGNRLVFFDEAQGKIASSVAMPASAVRAIVPSVAGLSASGVGVTPLTEAAAATVANASGVVDVTNLPVASAVGANAAGLALAQKLNGGTTIADVLLPPKPVNAPNMALGAAASDEYAKVLHTLANLPQANAAVYGANAFEAAIKMRDSILAGKVLPASFDADAGAAYMKAKLNYTGVQTAPASAVNADFKAIMSIAAGAIANNASAVAANNAAVFAAAQQVAAQQAFNAVSGVAPVQQAAITNAMSQVATMAQTATQALVANIGKLTAVDAMANVIQAAANAGLSGQTAAQAQAAIAGMFPAGAGAAAGAGGTTAGGTTTGGTSVAQFVGTYSGTFTGTDSGTWTATVSSTGQITATGNSNKSGALSASGSVGSNGAATFGTTSNAATFTGTISAGTFSGTWTNSLSGGSGTFTGTLSTGTAATGTATGGTATGGTATGGTATGGTATGGTANAGGTTGGAGVTMSVALSGSNTVPDSVATYSPVSTTRMSGSWTNATSGTSVTVTYENVAGVEKAFVSIMSGIQVGTLNGFAGQLAANGWTGYCGLVGNYAPSPSCASLGMTFNRVGGKVSFSNTIIQGLPGYTVPGGGNTLTLNGTLSFTPF